MMRRMSTPVNDPGESSRKSARCRVAKIVVCVVGSLTLLILAIPIVWIGYNVVGCWMGQGLWCPGSAHDKDEPPYLRYDLQWSPDGEYIVFADNRSTHSVTANGTSLHLIQERINHNQDDFSISISPDGSRVVYSTYEYPKRETPPLRKNDEIATSRMDGSDRKRITETQVFDNYPSWSPDGKFFALLRFPHSQNATSKGGLYMVAADGSDPKLLLLLPYSLSSLTKPVSVSGVPTLVPGPLSDFPQGDHRGPIWSPSGEMLAFSGSLYHWRPQAHSIYVINSDGTGLSAVFSASGVIETKDSGRNSLLYAADLIIGTPAWSPDSKKLALMRYIEDDYGELMGEEYSIAGEPGLALYEVGVDGTDFREIVKLGPRFACDGAVAWSPNEPSILVSYFQPNRPQSRFCGDINHDSDQGHVHVVDVTSGNAQRIGEGAHAVWSPDGSRVAVFNPFSDDVIYTANPDGSDIQALVKRNEDGELVAANRRCVLFFCWSVAPAGV